MSTTPQIPAGLLAAPMVDANGMLTPIWQRWMTETLTRTVSSLTLQGEIASRTPIQGRAEPLAQTVQNVDGTGKVLAAGVGFTVDAVDDGSTYKRTTVVQVDGATRAAAAIDSNNRLAGSIHNNPVNTSNTPTSAVGMTNDGIHTAVQIPASSNQYDFGLVNYHSGSIDPNAFGTWYVFTDDPTFAGGIVNYQFSATPVSQTANPGRVVFGAITTVAAAVKTGGGYSGGTTPGGGGGRGYVI